MTLHIGSEDRVLPPSQSRLSMGASHHTGLRRMLARYSRFVALMKMLLPAIAVALLGLVTIWPKVAPRNSVFKEAFAGFDIKSVDTMAMQNPRYYGTDNKNAPFTVTATVATQVQSQPMVVALENPQGDFTQKSGSGMIITSDNGLFRQKEDILDLLGHVDLYQDTGYEVHTNSARLDVAKSNAWGDEPTAGKGPAGTIEGEGFRLMDRGSDVTFTGKAKAVLFSAKGANSTKAKDKGRKTK